MTRILLALLVLLVPVSGWQGYRLGVRATEAVHNAEILLRIEAGKELEAERLKLVAERDDLSRKLEEAAHADPVVVPRCLGPNRVRRLNALR